MPKSSGPSTHPMVFPPDNRTAECDEWCAALHLVEARVADLPDGKFFDVDDFMIMGGWRRRGKPMIYLYKHRHTRRYINVDMNGTAWRYVEPAHLDDDHPGSYRRLPGLDVAVARLELSEMPFMVPERYGVRLLRRPGGR